MGSASTFETCFDSGSKALKAVTGNSLASVDIMEDAQSQQYMKVQMRRLHNKPCRMQISTLQEGKGSEARVKISGEDTKRKDERGARKDAEEKRGGHMLHAVFQIFPM